ncbi:hypothetical protein, partial [Peribacillus simplex]|uniref:hypothetical protein n=1 Tax=Peribacillus simplex TaxID=1478 RepID=UPI003D2CD0BF
KYAKTAYFYKECDAVSGTDEFLRECRCCGIWSNGDNSFRKIGNFEKNLQIVTITFYYKGVVLNEKSIPSNKS